MNELKISLILPCYNVENYIETSLNTIFTQDLSENEYEVICVNDCSTDNTERIINKFQEIHKNLYLINQPENKKQGAARNKGFNTSSGKYIWFIDPDDFITDNCLSNIYNELENNSLDILEFNINITDENLYPEFKDVNFENQSEIISGIEYLELLMKLHWGRSVEVWRRVYSRDFLIKNKLSFPEYVFGTEDVLFFYESIVYSTRFKHITEYYYTYRIDNEQSVTNNRSTIGLKLADKIISNVDVIRFFNNCELIHDIEFKIKAVDSYKWSIRFFLKKVFILDKYNLPIFILKISKYKSEIKEQLNRMDATLLTQPLLIKVINAIFVPTKYLYNKIKRV